MTLVLAGVVTPIIALASALIAKRNEQHLTSTKEEVKNTTEEMKTTKEEVASIGAQTVTLHRQVNGEMEKYLAAAKAEARLLGKEERRAEEKAEQAEARERLLRAAQKDVAPYQPPPIPPPTEPDDLLRLRLLREEE